MVLSHSSIPDSEGSLKIPGRKREEKGGGRSIQLTQGGKASTSLVSRLRWGGRTGQESMVLKSDVRLHFSPPPSPYTRTHVFAVV